MKRSVIFVIVALTVLAVGLASLAGEKGRGKGPGRRGPGARRQWMQRMADANAPADANSPWAQRRAEMRERAQKAFEKRVGRLKEIREIAAGEGATKTVEALDKLIAEVEENFKKRQERLDSEGGLGRGGPPRHLGRGPRGVRHRGRPGGPPGEPPEEPEE